MTRPLAIVRPEPGWSASAAAARSRGLAVVGHPVFVVEPVAWLPPEARHDALLIGSAAAIRQAGPALARYAGLPVFAVGEATAQAARDFGLTVARAGAGGLQALLDAEAAVPRRYLRLGGEERVALTPHPGQAITECTVYRLRPLPISDDFAQVLAQDRPLIALHSAAAARHFAAEAERCGLARGGLFLLALGPRVAKAAGLGWAAIHLVAPPHDAALLAKAAALCE